VTDRPYCLCPQNHGWTDNVRHIPLCNGCGRVVEAEVLERGREIALPEGAPRKGKKIVLAVYLKNRKAAGLPPFDPDSAVAQWNGALGIPHQWVAMAWREFKYQHTEGTNKLKTYSDWAAAFLNCLKQNWYNYWRRDNKTNTWVLTDTGIAAEMHLKTHITA